VAGALPHQSRRYNQMSLMTMIWASNLNHFAQRVFR
jgi:hypothetical protein